MYEVLLSTVTVFGYLGFITGRMFYARNVHKWLHKSSHFQDGNFIRRILTGATRLFHRF